VVDGTTALLAPLTAAPERAALLLDFDGVLAPIVARPEDAYPPTETRAELQRLVPRYGLVAVVSGRPGEDVRKRAPPEGVVYAGAHGLELDPEAERWRQQIADFASAAPWPAAETELKGLSVAFHYRQHADEQGQQDEDSKRAPECAADECAATAQRAPDGSTLLQGQRTGSQAPDNQQVDRGHGDGRHAGECELRDRR
jgi:trehalose 6-phosphate phosphatase